MNTFKKLQLFIPYFLLSIAASCSPTLSSFPPDTNLTSTDAPILELKEVVPRGKRLLGMGVTEGKEGFQSAFGVARDAGLQFIELPLQWEELEPSPGKYENAFLGIINIYFPITGTKVVISLNPIDTNNLRLPSDLKNLPFDDPRVIARYKKAIDYVLGQLSNVEILALSVGNEVDAYLGTDKTKWEQYTRFFQEISKYVRNKRPKIQIGVKAIMTSLLQENREEMQAINEHTDVVMATFYPLEKDFSVQDTQTIPKTIGKLLALYQDKPVYLLEVGYPASKHLGSSEVKQAQFIIEIFRAWDAHQDQLRLVNFIWLHDISPKELATYKKYYKVSEKGFGEYLGTLGLRTFEGKDKQAFQTLRNEAKSRGW